MRPRAVAGGAVLLVVGLVSFLVPTVGQPVESATATPTAPATFWEPGLTPAGINFTLDWYSSSSVTVSVYSCGSDTSCSGGSRYETAPHLVARGNGPGGSMSFPGAPGTGYEVYASSSTPVDISYTGALFGGFLGAFFALLGGLGLLLGLLLKPRKAPSPTTMAPTTRTSGALASPAPPPPPAPPAAGGTPPGSEAGIAGFRGMPGERPPPPPGR